MKIAAVIAGVLLVLCLGLFFSSRGILVWSKTPESKLGFLQCTYFTGAGFVDRQELYTQQGFLGGREACPRFTEIKS